MTSVQYHVTSYDSGRKPFTHDPKRGKWASPSDFVFACIGHSFGSLHFTVLSLMFYWSTGLLGIVPMVIFMLMYSIPMFVIQSFLGQFSSTGYISAFRIAPLMKGIGYVILIVNIISIPYGSFLSAIPLIFILNSFTFNLPWMNCDNNYNTYNCTTLEKIKEIFDDLEKRNASEDDYYESRLFVSAFTSSTEYYRNFIHILSSDNEFRVSWPIFFCLLIVWALATVIVLQGIEWLGSFFRKMCFVMATFLFVIFLRSIFLLSDNWWNVFVWYRSYALVDLDAWFTAPAILVITMGSGWGNIISLASYNKFNANTIKLSWLVCGSIGFINLLTGALMGNIDMYANEILEVSTRWKDEHPVLYFLDSIPLVLGSLELPNMWTLIFFSMIFIGEILTIVVQLHSIITAICDEFENLREIRKEITVALIVIQMLLSFHFCFNHSYDLLSFLLYQEVLPQQMLCLLMILIVLWIYGRVRFQRDFKIMNNVIFSNCKIFMIRFITPLIILLLMLWSFFESYFHSFRTTETINIWQTLTSYILLFSFIGILPVYIILKLIKTTGTIEMRIRTMLRPTDWYPAEREDRQRYEENLGTSDISHQLVEMEIDLDT